MVEYFGFGLRLWWLSRSRRNLIFFSPLGKKRIYKTYELLAIDTELPIVERVTALPFIQKFLPVFHLTSLLFLQVF